MDHPHRRRRNNHHRTPTSSVLLFLLVLGTIYGSTESFVTQPLRHMHSPFQYRGQSEPHFLASCRDSNQRESHTFRDDDRRQSSPPEHDRRSVLQKCLVTSVALTTTAAIGQAGDHKALAADGDATEVKTQSGLRYMDLEQGGNAAGYNDATPQYGQLCVISYTAYMKLPNANDKQKFASSTGFVIKHGNGKMIAGLDEGIHGMKRGGLRRLIIPPKLGFVANGLGPLPEMPWQRWKLNLLLDDMVAQRGGNLIYDVRLERFFDDEADQGYYQDEEISPEERAELESRLLKGRTGAGASGASAVDAVGEDANVMERGREKPIV